MPHIDKLSGLTASQINEHELESKEALSRLMTTNERITDLIGKATIDNLGPLYAALAIAAQQSSSDRNDTARIKRAEAFRENEITKKTYQGANGYGTAGHWATIGGSIVSLAVNGYCALRGIQAAGYSETTRKLAFKNIGIYQTAGGSVGSAGQGVGTFLTAGDEGTRSSSEFHKQRATSANQQEEQEANTAKQLAKQLYEQKSQTEESRHRAMGEFARS